MKISQVPAMLLALFPVTSLGKEVLSFEGGHLRKKQVDSPLSGLDKFLRKQGPHAGGDDKSLVTSNIPEKSAKAVAKLAASICSSEELPESGFRVDIGGETYYCDQEGVGYIANAATTAVAENLVVQKQLEESGDVGVVPALIVVKIACILFCWSREDFKRDISYLNTSARDEIGQMFLDIPIATWNYKNDSVENPQRLGFIIEDIEPSFAVTDQVGDSVNLYGFISMAAATIQMQQDQIKQLQEEMKDFHGIVSRTN